MLLGKDVLYCIALFIDDPTSWRNFALVCRSAAKACRLLEGVKMDQFVVKSESEGFQGCPCCEGMFTGTKSVLPNGTRHGHQTFITTDYGKQEERTFETYINGKMTYQQIQCYEPHPDTGEWKLIDMNTTIDIDLRSQIFDIESK
jgi:hypothetical protein